MEKIIKQAEKSLDIYFKTLSVLGYIKTSEVKKLLVFLFISELLDGKYKENITEEDYKILIKCIYCIYGSSCLFPYPNHTIECLK